MVREREWDKGTGHGLGNPVHVSSLWEELFDDQLSSSLRNSVFFRVTDGVTLDVSSVFSCPGIP